jgi:hypothetical protein
MDKFSLATNQETIARPHVTPEMKDGRRRGAEIHGRLRDTTQ